MVLTYTTVRNLYGNLTSNSTASNLTLGDSLISAKLTEVQAMRDWYFLYTTTTESTVASQQFYDLPADVGRLLYPSVVFSTTRYTPKRAPSRRFWDELNTTTSVTSDTPEWYFVFNDQVGFYPTFSSASGTITFAYKRRQKELSLADYTTGTIDTATNADETIVGSSTAWTAPMAQQRWLKITESNTAASSGDGFWYEIDSITDATNLELKKKYQGTTIGAAASGAYTIGQLPLLPANFHQLPVYGAVAMYFLSVKPNMALHDRYQRMYEQGIEQLAREHGMSTTDPSIEERDGAISNPNFHIEL